MNMENLNLNDGLEISNYLLQAKCLESGHEDHTYIMVCLNENCKERGQVLCPECQFDKHNHPASESFITLQRLKKYFQENQDVRKKMIQDNQHIFNQFLQLKKKIMIQLEYTENSLYQKIQELNSVINFSSINQLDFSQKNTHKIQEALNMYCNNVYMCNKQIHYKERQINIENYQYHLEENLKQIQTTIENIQLNVDQVLEKQSPNQQTPAASQFELEKPEGRIIMENIELELQTQTSPRTEKNTPIKQPKFKETESRFQVPSTGSWYYDGELKCDAIVIELKDKKKKGVTLWGIKCNKIKDWENNQEIEYEVIICQGSDLTQKQIFQQSYTLKQNNSNQESQFSDLIFEQGIPVEQNKKYVIGIKFKQNFESTQGKKPKEIELFKISECTNFPEGYADNGTCIEYGQIPKFIYSQEYI